MNNCENMKPIIIFDDNEPTTILCMVMIPIDTDVSEVRNIITDVKNKYPTSWSMEEILEEFVKHDDWEIYNCQDIREMFI